MDTDQTRQTAGLIRGSCQDMAQLLRTLDDLSKALRIYWRGPEAEAVCTEFERTIKQLGHYVENGVELSAQLRREVEAWERNGQNNRLD
jgi:hypothetical protein